MQEFIIQVIENFGYIGITLLIAIENIFPPIPSEVILAFGGFMTTKTSLTILGVVISATIGSTLGAIILYYIGRVLNKDRIENIVSGKVGQILRLKAEDIEKAHKWFNKKGQKTVFICRFIPVVRSLISIPAGMSKMEFHKFILYTVIGSSIWNILLTILGKQLGDSWEKVVYIFSEFSHIVLIALILILIAGIIWFYKNKKK